jgi:type VI secretion system protein ImpF
MSMSASDGWRERPGTEKRRPDGIQRAAREAVQPSLWDRLVNDLPGLTSEIDALRRSARSQIDADRLDALIEGGARLVDAAPELDAEQKSLIHRLLFQERRRAKFESRSIVVSAEVLREAVRRDIEALFNTERFEAVPLLTDLEADQVSDSLASLEDFPEVRRSVVNYGVPPYSGRSVRDFDREALAREIRCVLAAFEPRLKASATKVTVTTGDKITGLRIDIEAILIMSPAPERLRLRTMIDLNNGLARTEMKDA